jgi:isopentenyldiphosphate isomerase
MNILGIYSLAKAEGGAIHHPVKIIFTGKISEERGDYNTDEISEIRWFLPEEIYAMDKKTLRDEDIKQMVRDYFAGKRYPLDLVTHTVQK